jgi:hypothetical protein
MDNWYDDESNLSLSIKGAIGSRQLAFHIILHTSCFSLLHCGHPCCPAVSHPRAVRERLGEGNNSWTACSIEYDGRIDEDNGIVSARMRSVLVILDPVQRPCFFRPSANLRRRLVVSMIRAEEDFFGAVEAKRSANESASDENYTTGYCDEVS